MDGSILAEGEPDIKDAWGVYKQFHFVLGL